MRKHWLSEIYQNIKKARNERLSRALSLLGKKAASDPEIAEVLNLLRPWVLGQGQAEEPSSLEGLHAVSAQGYTPEGPHIAQLDERIGHVRDQEAPADTPS